MLSERRFTETSTRLGDLVAMVRDFWGRQAVAMSPAVLPAVGQGWGRKMGRKTEADAALGRDLAT